MQRKTEELQLAVQEYLDVDWTAVKHYLRRQIAKCVQECKSQASNAKRIARTIKHNHTQVSVPSNGAYDSDDSDDWGTDFDDDDEEEEVKSEEVPAELNNNTISPISTGSVEKISTQVLANSTTPAKFIPKPPDLPVIPTSVNGSNGYKKSQHTNSIPRQPVKRPLSQPPPPPIPQASSHHEPQEEYEIPINVQSNIVTTTTEKQMFTFSNIPLSTAASNDSSVIETYEIIEPVEEDYEMVDAPHMSVSNTSKPTLPPRGPLSPGLPPPPPLPQKPRKLHEGIQERPEGVRTFSRPKLPAKVEEETQDNSVSTSSSGSIGSTFFTSLLGRRGSSTPTSSPKTQHRSRDGSEGVSSNVSTVSSNDGHSSRSSTPDRDVLVPAGYFSSNITSSEVKKPLSPPPPLPPRGALSPDDTAQNMATRPLPPVPVPNLEDNCTNKQLQDDVSLCPWFHEIEREDAERVIRGLLQSGSFLVRPSKRAGKENPYSVTILHEGRLFHLNIRQRSDNTFALGKEKRNEKTFKTVADLILYHQTDPILLTSRGEPAGTTVLSKYPDKTQI